MGKSMTPNRDPTIRFCPNCGTDVGEGARFCVNCGEALPGVGAAGEPKDGTAGTDAAAAEGANHDTGHWGPKGVGFDHDGNWVLPGDPPGERTEFCSACAAEMPEAEGHIMSHDHMRIAADRGYGKEIDYTADLMTFEKKAAFRELVDQGADNWRLCDPCQAIFLGYL